MHRSTILTLALAAVNTTALLTKRDSSTSVVSTSTAPADVITVTSTDASDSSATSSNPSPNSSSDEDYDDSAFAVPDPARPCYPRNATGSPDFAAPCNQIAAIEAQCSYGSKALEFISLPFDSDEYTDFNDAEWQEAMTSPETERACICKSQIIDATLGCLTCMTAHKVPDINYDADTFGDFIHTMMGQYCNTSYTPTQSFIEFSSDAQEAAFGEGDFGSEDGMPEGGDVSTSYASDPIGTATDVSLYYTMSVTRSDAYDIAVPTPATSGGNVTYTSTRTSDGEIVPTAEAARESSGSGGSSGSGSDAASSTSSADSGAATGYAGAGLLAIAALAAVGL